MKKRISLSVVSIVVLAVLFYGCTAKVPEESSPPESSTPQAVSSAESASSENINDWMLSAIARNAAFAPYMTMQEYDQLFGTSGMMPANPVVSPNGQKLAYIYPNEFEEPCDLYLYDIATKKAEKLLQQQNLPQSDGFKQAAWVDDQSLLLIIGYRFGTVTPGGKVCLLNLAEAPNLYLLYQPAKDTEQVLSAVLSGNTLTMKVAVFDANMEKYTEEPRTAEVDLKTAPLVEPSESSAPAESDILATIFNFPTQEKVAAYPAAETLALDQSGESFLLVPKQEGTRIIIETVEYDSVKEDFLPDQTIYDKTSGDGYALWLKVVRPEGGPHLRITLKYGNDSAQYYVTYDGKDGNVADEYIAKAS